MYNLASVISWKSYNSDFYIQRVSTVILPQEEFHWCCPPCLLSQFPFTGNNSDVETSDDDVINVSIDDSDDFCIVSDVYYVSHVLN